MGGVGGVSVGGVSVGGWCRWDVVCVWECGWVVRVGVDG